MNTPSASTPPQARFGIAVAAAARRVHPHISAASHGDIVAALTATARDRAGVSFTVGAGSWLRKLYTGMNKSWLSVTAEDESGWLTIDRESDEYTPTADTSWRMAIHRDLRRLISWANWLPTRKWVSKGGTHGFSHVACGCRSAVALDEEYARGDVAEVVLEKLGRDSAVIDAVNTETDTVLAEVFAASPANGAGPVRYIIAGSSGKPVAAKLTDIALPYAAATVSSRSGRDTARINVYLRRGFWLRRNL
ncbi:hypothetical protein [Mycolicibacterium mageritense]|uniref:Uncharacterized protein n=1 Tax=Mycolicibacterium mageritense TaxID=53462 RepID=A0ABN5YL21_MYCME|nr:hypothetical protein [Mycolicibacterium mageritense]BBX38528.1 hypothetical protein MMAGJ_78100 [Mycolicibacterium mageritense]